MCVRARVRVCVDAPALGAAILMIFWADKSSLGAAVFIERSILAYICICICCVVAWWLLEYLIIMRVSVLNTTPTQHNSSSHNNYNNNNKKRQPHHAFTAFTGCPSVACCPRPAVRVAANNIITFLSVLGVRHTSRSGILLLASARRWDMGIHE